ncbi:unnamed protein product [Bursaphelenchus xylophilus]|uniref:(pine wood nematode) hypothetical protein n=1 Tax=Bursaphelenchus xylophilus TaxID=6326 RepID=A0A1I7RW76_BURXY|nr:unnamed protein product [Bursaphelenchus xylophilus]CAG9095232.1 unnamed protein product [Bursaphelenchus xylophilus]
MGCMRSICGGNPKSDVRPCRPDGSDCGGFNQRRHDHIILPASDIVCPLEEAIYAPFDGKLSYYQPFGGESDYQCADQGVRIDGTGQWRGYHVLIYSVVPFRYGGDVVAGEKLGTAGQYECILSQKAQNPQNYVRVELFRDGQPVDITHHLTDCMCTGQICETNHNNRIVGQPFASKSLFNGIRGWEIACPLREENSEEIADASYEDAPLAPTIYSPIEGEILGRMRLNFKNNVYAGCSNEALFIQGTGTWTDYDVKIFNVRYREELGFGRKHIEQGQPVGRRLVCPDSTDSIFLEVRFQGTVINITDAILAKSCRHKLPDGLL